MKLTEEEKEEIKMILKEAKTIIGFGLFLLIIMSGLAYMIINK
jgi:hypothetical protein